MILHFLFWGCIFLVFHSYVLYPILLQVFSVGKKSTDPIYNSTDDNLPEVFVVMSVFNEERVLLEKLESLFTTSYPHEKLHVFIGSDNSSDNTGEIVKSYDGGSIEKLFFQFEERNGKPKVLNKLVKIIFERDIEPDSTVFIFTDANVIFTSATIFELVKQFKYENIGQVGANILNIGERNDGISQQETSYIKRENKMKYLEGLNWGAMIGAFGACYALRASLWKYIPDDYQVEDFYLGMHVLSKNSKSKLEMKAICYEDVSNDMLEEFRRKVRIQTGNFQNLREYWPLIFRFDAVAFCFLSHKVIRWLGPLFIVISYSSNVLLLSIHPFYVFTFVLQNLLLASPIIDKMVKQMGGHLTILRFSAYFIMMNIALTKGFIMYLLGVKTSVWNPTKRNV